MSPLRSKLAASPPAAAGCRTGRDHPLWNPASNRSFFPLPAFCVDPAPPHSTLLAPAGLASTDLSLLYAVERPQLPVAPPFAAHVPVSTSRTSSPEARAPAAPAHPPTPTKAPPSRATGGRSRLPSLPPTPLKRQTHSVYNPEHTQRSHTPHRSTWNIPYHRATACEKAKPPDRPDSACSPTLPTRPPLAADRVDHTDTAPLHPVVRPRSPLASNDPGTGQLRSTAALNATRTTPPFHVEQHTAIQSFDEKNSPPTPNQTAPRHARGPPAPCASGLNQSHPPPHPPTRGTEPSATTGQAPPKGPESPAASPGPPPRST